MQFQQLLSLVTYQIEPKVGGGFVAHASDPAAPPIEAPTRAELQEKISVNIREKLTTTFPGLKLPLDQDGTQFGFYIERKPEGGLIVHTNDGREHPLPGNNHPEIQSAVMDKIMDVLSRHFMPELSKALAGQGGAGNAQLFASSTTEFASTQPAFITSDAGQITPSTSIQAGFDRSQQALDPSSNSLFTPESSGLGRFIRLLILAVIIGAVIYFLRHQ
jgi:hypothetical protein